MVNVVKFILFLFVSLLDQSDKKGPITEGITQEKNIP